MKQIDLKPSPSRRWFFCQYVKSMDVFCDAKNFIANSRIGVHVKYSFNQEFRLNLVLFFFAFPFTHFGILGVLRV